MDKSNKEWSTKMDQLRHHETNLDFGLEWEKLEERLAIKKKRRPVFFYLPVILGLAAMLLQLFYHPLSNSTSESFKQLADSNLNFENEKEEIIEVKSQTFESETKSIANVNLGNDLQRARNVERKRISGPVSMLGITKWDATANHGTTPINSNQSKFASQVDANSSANQIITLGVVDSNKRHGNDIADFRFYLNKMEKLDGLNHGIYFKENYDVIAPMPIQHIQPRVNSLWMDASFSIGKVDETYQLVDIENADLMNQKRNSDKPLEAIMARLAVSKSIGKGFFIKGGMNYFQINERFSLESIDTIHKISPGEINEVYTDHNGLVSIGTGEKNIVQMVSNHKIRYNNIRIYGASLGFGKVIKYRKGRIAILADVVFPISSSFHGQSLISNGNVGSLDQVYTTQKNIQYGIQTHYAYPVYKNIELYGGYDYTFNKLSTNLGYTRNQNIHFLSLGMSYYLN